MEKREFFKKIQAAAGEKDKEKAYWLEKLAGDLEIPCFPYDFNRDLPGNRQPKEVKVETGFSFNGETFERLTRVSGDSLNRLYMVLTASLLVLLERYSGKPDLLVGAPIFKQEIEADFLNTLLVFRNTL